MESTFYWFDFETTGVDPARHRPVQFAGIRTDFDFNEIGEPLNLLARLPNDHLPEPEACLVTGLTPDKLKNGLSEKEFIARINQELSVSNTCALGYNSLRFDDEVIRNSCYRNFLDPYAREWQNGNSRWDIIDLVRCCAALRPDGICWPVNDEGVKTFRLELLTQANGISHESAHDALSDVRATISLAKLIKETQPKLFNYVFENRSKAKATQLLSVDHHPVLLHVSGMFGAAKNFIAPITPLAWHPTNKNGVIVYDLTVDPEPLLTLSVDEIHERVFTKTDILEENGLSRIPLKTVHMNRCPVLSPINVLRAEDVERLNLNQAVYNKHYKRLEAFGFAKLAEKISLVHQVMSKPSIEESDPDLMIYSGGFFSQSDKRKINQVHQTSPNDLAGLDLSFEDNRLPEMLFRYRARNWFALLNREEQHQWNSFRKKSLLKVQENGKTVLEEYINRINSLKETYKQERDSHILDDLIAYGTKISNELKQAK